MSEKKLLPDATDNDDDDDDDDNDNVHHDHIRSWMPLP